MWYTGQHHLVPRSHDPFGQKHKLGHLGEITRGAS